MFSEGTEASQIQRDVLFSLQTCCDGGVVGILADLLLETRKVRYWHRRSMHPTTVVSFLARRRHDQQQYLWKENTHLYK